MHVSAIATSLSLPIMGDATGVLVSGASINTKTLSKGDAFFALKGERVDGHDYVSAAEKAGASVAVVERYISDVSIPQIRSDDVAKTFGDIATLWLQQFDLKKIAITGSVGKTTVKEMLFGVLSESSNCVVTKGNLNNHLGVPLTMFSVSDTHDVAIFEMGANHAKEIEYSAGLVRPDISVVTCVAAAHIEGFGDLDGVADAKGEIYQALPEYGVAIVNADDNYAAKFMRQAHTIYTFGIDNQADVMARELESNEVGEFSFSLCVGDENTVVNLPLLGRHQVNNALAVAAIAIQCGVGLSDIATRLSSVSSVHGRMERSALTTGCELINDTYNANPASVRAAVDALSERSGKTAIILGDMGELGESAVEEHINIGRYAAEHGVDYCIAIGEFSEFVVEGYGATGKQFPDKVSAHKYVSELSMKVDVILVKGSRGAAMETVVAFLNDEGQQ